MGCGRLRRSFASAIWARKGVQVAQKSRRVNWVCIARCSRTFEPRSNVKRLILLTVAEVVRRRPGTMSSGPRLPIRRLAQCGPRRWERADERPRWQEKTNPRKINDLRSKRRRRRSTPETESPQHQYKGPSLDTNDVQFSPSLESFRLFSSLTARSRPLDRVRKPFGD
jgi:hypothetical protein